MPETFKNAVAAALVTAVLTIPLLGMQLQLEGYRVVLNTHWTPVLVAVLAVFLFQLAKPALSRTSAGIKLPALPRMQPGQQRAAVLILLMAALVWPFFGSRGYVDVMTLALIYVVLGLGLNIVVGFAGLLDLGYVGFYAVGAYTYALCNQYFGLSFWECVPLSAAAAALFGFLLGFPVLRLRGDYLAIVTLGFGEIIRLLLNNMTSLTGGPDGISGIPKPTVFGVVMARNPLTEDGTTFHQLLGLTYQGGHMVIFLYFLALLMVLFTYFVTSRLLRMPMGRAWEALREDEIACRSLGINPTRVKLSAFTLGAAFAGLAGSFFAARQGLVTPESFTFIESALILAIVVLGGMGSQLGVILAAILLTVLPELARSFAEYRMLIFGLVMVLMMMWRPQGLLPATRPHVELPQ
ncbi:high-affinity branched-chain amino acid ABC transporter permease LivM [Herbaspirillum huttiense F1]|jgi:L-leucine ABC transporter membrane protein/L-isoleucine ABC transporter membrane protein/L-valine ABC transporter membrane protein|uniref:High-affinity branched-chain amino acid ABC transporter permease LivM n=1 Tax=Herbaspirillum huttiense subsp. lycopersici TaxID=3074428 RepID=A0ABU2ETT6_9BURK|nr:MULTISPECIES: high-affinity branched-chain amino acid ABC transporter permease LivM [Herbaspirillum]MBN9357997.1 high-affinity branched-chain amino acid ABC transporter permease LivM [Herbaspirillum huttiense]MDR6740384.1 branched-chain amino acid transport system permease protein [Herbaspirillum sp. 1173]MDR9851574.1 high-affinity branched-chain amino acid ABC transporter permease LivM [Herbaspirillum huttiense SE1]MDT0359178.1 high-affinity branched-chain amino acid ABC transporter permeas